LDIHFEYFQVVRLRGADAICNACYARWYLETDTVSFKPFDPLTE